MLIILKIIFLFLGVLYVYSNTVNAWKGHGVNSFKMTLMTIGIVGFVVIQFKLYL